MLYVDECHLIWDDVRGYVWAPSNQRVAVPMTNFRERQTYYGAIDPVSGTVHVIPTDTANGNWTMIFVEYLRQEYGDKRLFLLWDGASYSNPTRVVKYGILIWWLSSLMCSIQDSERSVMVSIPADLTVFLLRNVTRASIGVRLPSNEHSSAIAMRPSVRCWM